MSTPSLASILKLVGILSTGVYTGFTFTLGHAAIPSILDYGNLDLDDKKNEARVLSQWRHLYLEGSTFSKPMVAINLLSYGYLAYTTSSVAATPYFGISVKGLYTTAAILCASSIPWALTLLRQTNGALAIRAQKVLGEYKGPEEQTPLKYAQDEKAPQEREASVEYNDTKDLVRTWVWHNQLRAFVLLLGAAAGAAGTVYGNVAL